MNKLTPRQRQIIELRLQGLMYKQVAAKLGIGYYTVKSTVEKAYNVLGVCNMRQLRAILAGQEEMSA